MSERVIIFDTTLRDGEQSPGASMTTAEKLRVAHALDELGVDVMEAGFPISSPDDFAAVQKISREVRRPVIAALARTRPEDIRRAAEAVEGAERPRIHTFIATSRLHLERKLGISEAECLEQAAAGVELALQYASDVEFSAEDATRTDLDFLCKVVTVAVEAGATTINLPDTVGYTLPTEITRIFRTLQEKVPGIERVVLSTHCHNDLGLAVANSLAALEAGARQVECTINGIGERAGNAALEEVVMAIRVRRDLLGLETGIHTHRIHPTSSLLSKITGIHPQPNKAIVGRNAFAHEAGIHQDGMLKERQTYEIMDPAMVGVPGSRLVLGKHSGRHALRVRFQELGYELDQTDMERAYRLFKLLADQKKDILDEDLLAIVHHGAMRDIPATFGLERMHVECGGEWSHAKLTIRVAGRGDVEAEGKGDGPIAAAFDAVNRVVGWDVELEDLTIRAATPGGDAVGEGILRVQIFGKTFTGSGASTDIVDAAVRAYLHALNKAAYAQGDVAESPEGSAAEKGSKELKGV
ncbi:MAG: 2-isopropylmalate synthase [Gemmatimonadota bacterium]